MANRDLARLLLTAISAASLTLSSALLMASTPSSLQSSIELLLLRRPVTLSNILEEKRDYSEFQKNVYLCYMTHLSKSIHLLDHPLLNSYDSEWFFVSLNFTLERSLFENLDPILLLKRTMKMKMMSVSGQIWLKAMKL